MKNSVKFTRAYEEQQKALEARMGLEDAVLSLIEKWNLRNCSQLSTRGNDHSYIITSPDKIYDMTLKRCLRWDSGLDATEMSYYTVTVFKQAKQVYSFDCSIGTPNYERCRALWERIKDTEQNEGIWLKEEFEAWLRKEK
jgi:hypothetical protein